MSEKQPEVRVPTEHELAARGWMLPDEGATPRPVELANGLLRVTFDWSTDHGPCYDCALPAAFRAELYPGTPEPYEPVCCVCAANHACNGTAITRLEE